MNRNTLSVVGFVIFFLGFIALVLSMVNLQISFLTILDKPGRTFGLVVKLSMIFIGIIILYMSKADSGLD